MAMMMMMMIIASPNLSERDSHYRGGSRKNIWGAMPKKVGDFFSRRPQNTRQILLNEPLRSPKCSFTAAVTNFFFWGGKGQGSGLGWRLPPAPK